jgi:hypothetical protein
MATFFYFLLFDQINQVDIHKINCYNYKLNIFYLDVNILNLITKFIKTLGPKFCLRQNNNLD